MALILRAAANLESAGRHANYSISVRLSEKPFSRLAAETRVPDSQELLLVNGENVWMVERRSGERFLPEASYPLLFTGVVLGKQLHRYRTFQSFIMGQVNVPHPAGPQRPDNLTRSQLVGGEGSRLFYQQARRFLDSRTANQTLGHIMCYERFNFFPQLFIAAARLIEKCGTFRGLAL